MEKLEKLTQEDNGKILDKEGHEITQKFLFQVGKIRTLVVANPILDVSKEIDKMAEQNSCFIPQGANAYVASDWNPDTQHLRKTDLEEHEKLYSVFAVQFYYI